MEFSQPLLQWLSVGATALSALFSLRGDAGMTAAMIAGVSGTAWDYNKEQVEALASQCADAWVARAFLLLALLFQIGAVFLPPGSFSARPVLASVGLTFLLGVAGHLLSVRRKIRLKEAALRLLEKSA
jgi:hypothetical protein